MTPSATALLFFHHKLIAPHFQNDDLRQFFSRLKFNAIEQVESPPNDPDRTADQLRKTCSCEKGKSHCLVQTQPLPFLLGFDWKQKPLAVLVDSHIEFVDFHLAMVGNLSANMGLQMKTSQTAKNVEDAVISHDRQHALLIACEVLRDDFGYGIRNWINFQ